MPAFHDVLQSFDDKFMDLGSLNELKVSSRRCGSFVLHSTHWGQLKHDLVQELRRREQVRLEAALAEAERLRAALREQERIRQQLQRQLDRQREEEEPWDPSDTD